MKVANSNLYRGIEKFISELDTNSIPKERKNLLDKLIAYIQSKRAKGLRINLNFICTHNSRRSHLAQVWAQTMAFHFNIDKISCYSGGTESTSVYPRVIETLKNTGYEIKKLSDGQNPVYSIKFSENEHPVIAYSKKFEDVFNPKSHFAAVMTCSQADDGCPFVAGSEFRIPITYHDPKEFDNSPEEYEKYLERSLQIANEMYFLFSKI
ncbi:protein-tyrosine-phosphatase [Hyphobacterium sp. CCMP332]|nr:protein-tyrosine-phosphatase [Hyphobacterium sp. CCMP332]